MIRTYGRAGGRPVIYLHGMPGAALEAELIDAAAARHGIELRAIERSHVAPGRDGEAYLNALADVIRWHGNGHRPPMLGFSIGAAIALRLARRLGEAAGPLLLFSIAGPLDLPNAFAGMGAGAKIFRAARDRPRVFGAAVRLQALLAAGAPGLLRRMLFAGAEPSDRAFAASPAGRAVLARAFRQAWAAGGAGYRRDLTTYVAPWSAELARVSAPVAFWHGRADTWAPLGMTTAVTQRLATSRLTIGEGGHYTTLIDGADAAFAALAENRTAA